jgi:hypothetical protein
MLKAKRDKDDPDLPVTFDGLADEPPQRLLSRLMTWAGVALLMAGAAIIAARTEAGSQRIARLFAPAPPVQVVQRAEPPRPVASDPMLAYETRRLADQVRVLAAIERTVGDVTASIPRQEAAPPRPVRMIETAPPPAARSAAPAAPPVQAPPPASSATPPSPAAAAPMAAPVPTPAPAQAAQPTPAPAAAAAPPPAAPAPPEAQESSTMRTEFGVDVAGEATMEALRTRWQQFRNQHGPIMEGLRPVVAVQDGRQGAVELRLVVGPLSNANAATRLCATLSAAGVNCKPAVFDGQRLAVR